MPPTIQELLKQAMAMPPADRALVAERLIASLDPEVDMDVEIAWQEEVARRRREIASGQVKPIPWEAVRDRLRGQRDASR
jgi:putative addiction module component (TIGR02574 family)